MPTDKKHHSFRLSDDTRAGLDRICTAQGLGSATEALEYAIRLAASPASLRAELVLGPLTSSKISQCLDVWGNMVAHAMSDNAEAFLNEEWCFIADVCNGTLWEPAVDNPAVLIAANVEDGHRLDGTGYKCLADEETELKASVARHTGGKPDAAMKAVDRKVSDLVKRIAALDAVHAWSMIHCVQYFWENCSSVNTEDRWYTLAYRQGKARGKK